MANCDVCGAVYKAKRADSRTCSPKCRKALQRLSVTKIKCDTLSVTDNASQDCAGDVKRDRPDTKYPLNYGQADCQCLHCQQDQGRHVLNHGPYKTAAELADNEINRTTLPGDSDYQPNGRAQTGTGL